MDHVLSTYVFAQHRLTTVWLDRIWGAGIPAVEIFCARQHLDYRNKAQIAELGHWFRDAQLKLHSLHSPLHSDEFSGRTAPSTFVNITETSKPRRLEMVDEVKRALEVAERVPFRYLVQHLGVPKEEFDEFKMEAAFSSLEEICLFAHNRGVQVVLENIQNELSTASRLVQFQQFTHLDVGFCLDMGHANMNEGVEPAFQVMNGSGRIRSTHIHDNNGKEDAHLFPMLAKGGTIEWRRVMDLLRSRPGQYPLVLELKESPDFPNVLKSVREVFEKLESQ
jgi:sugar phosphate isomerase/epimerase